MRETGVGPACGEVWGRNWGAIRSTGQRHWYLRGEEKESGREMDKNRQKQGCEVQAESSRFRISSGIGTEEHIQWVIKKVREAHEPSSPTEGSTDSDGLLEEGESVLFRSMVPSRAPLLHGCPTPVTTQAAQLHFMDHLKKKRIK